MQFSLIRPSTVESNTLPKPYDTDAESSLRSLGRVYSKCPQKSAPCSLGLARAQDWRDDGAVLNYSPTDPIGSCQGARNQQIDFPRMASEYQPCNPTVLEDWNMWTGTSTRSQAKDSWTSKCVTGNRFTG